MAIDVTRATDTLEQLAGELEGELRLDDLHRSLYAQDASVYQSEPVGVVFPRTVEDVQAIVRTADALGLGLIPRAAGTSLAGQCVGEGLVVDVGRHMNQILELNVEEKWVRVQPGVVLDELNRYLAPHGLFFGPDTSTSNRCMIGGMIGNNSCGSHSILYGNTMAHVLELGVVFADASFERVGAWSPEGLRDRMHQSDRLGEALRVLDRVVREHGELIEERYPRRDVVRRNTGYPLDDILWRAPYTEDGEDFSLARFLCGTEGTLGLVTEARLNLVERPVEKCVVCVHFDSLEASLRATVVAVKHDPAAVELIDRRVLEQTKQNIEQSKNRFWVEGDPDAVLVVEFYRESHQALEEACHRLIAEFRSLDMGYAYPVLRAPQDKAVWELRKAGLGLLMGIEGDVKPVTVVEDTAVAVDVLPDYVRDFAGIMDAYNTACVYYAHASVGELHLRPELNLKDPEDVRRFKGIAEDVADLVRRYRGAISGEHGDGRVRSPLLERFYGPEIMALHRQVKEGFDPQGIFNPRNIVDPRPIDADFRFVPGKPTPELRTYFKWEAERGLVRATELCNGAGVCRKAPEAGGTMCPSYMATRDEKDTTRGRANVFRTLLTGDEPEAAFESDALAEALDLCLSCKGCKSECPANVDMAKMKAEFLQQRYDRQGTPARALLFGHYGRLSKLGALVPWLANFMLSFALTRALFNAFFKLSPQRQMPMMAARSFDAALRRARKDGRLSGPDARAQNETVWLYVDPFTDFSEPEVGLAAVEVLEAAGYRVERFGMRDDGRTYLSKGMVRHARELMETGLESVEADLQAYPERRVVGLEPSALLTFRDELPDLVSERWRALADNLASRALLFEEFIAAEVDAGRWPQGLFETSRPQSALLHGHCHQKAICGTTATEVALGLAGYEVETLRTGCCGMAGSFGYEAEHYEVSMKVGELVLLPRVREMGAEQVMIAPGTSCRHQIADGAQREALHPTLALRARLKRG
ncbi:FAD-binding and (Fe-S)-binding domain-containing protein [Lujinxingia litoralis]|nr:FAD-binding and (Fe-S)-binding domain-containing protein [Lujinxingia litoralis]